MRIATAVRPVIQKIIRDAVCGEDQLIEVLSCSELLGIARDRKIDVAVIDPAVSGERHAGSALQFARAFPMIPILVYTVASPVTARALISLRELGVSRALLYPFEATGAIVREELHNAQRDHLVMEFLEVLSASLVLLPNVLQSAIRRMFASPAQFASASDLGLEADLPQSGVYRWFASAGLQPPKRMFIAARVLNAYVLFNDSRVSVKQVSERLGYNNPRILGVHAWMATQVRPSRLRYLAKPELVKKLDSWVRIAF